METISGQRLPRNSQSGYLPPLSLEAYELRQRLVKLFLETPDSPRSKRALKLAERANARFERREKSFRDSQQEVAA